MRHFLACCSLDARGFETKVTVQIGTESFLCRGLLVTEFNFLLVYPYQKWAETTLPEFTENERFVPTELMLNEHSTVPPTLLSEAELIGFMDKAGIGTDATIQQHIKTIIDRNYATKNTTGLFEPTPIGLGLVEGYIKMDVPLYEPGLRAEMENSMKAIANGERDRATVVNECVQRMGAVYSLVEGQMDVLKTSILDRVRANLAQEVPVQHSPGDVTCYVCGETGHVSTNCNRKQVRRCETCGVEGRHPNGSSCSSIRKRHRK